MYSSVIARGGRVKSDSRGDVGSSLAVIASRDLRSRRVIPAHFPHNATLLGCWLRSRPIHAQAIM